MLAFFAPLATQAVLFYSTGGPAFTVDTADAFIYVPSNLEPGRRYPIAFVFDVNADGRAAAQFFISNFAERQHWVVYGSKREGVRQLHVMHLAAKKEWRITHLKKGHAAMWPHWQPMPGG